MADRPSDREPLLAACDAVLRELAGFPTSPERLDASVLLIREIMSAVRAMDEVDVRDVEPMTTFRPVA